MQVLCVCARRLQSASAFSLKLLSRSAVGFCMTAMGTPGGSGKDSRIGSEADTVSAAAAPG